MSVQFPYYQQSGWNCSNCGAWVPAGCTHSCPTAVRWQNPPSLPPSTAEDRIAAALERIAAALEGSTTDDLGSSPEVSSAPSPPSLRKDA